MKNILITGGAGFIGSHVVRLFLNKYPDYTIYNLDKLTYAGNLENLKDIENFIVDLNNTESLIKKNPQISNHIINNIILDKVENANIQI